MKRIILLFTVALCSNMLLAQKFFFPKNAVSDSLLLEKNLINLTSKIIPTYKNSGKVDSLDKLSKLEIVAGNYPKAIATINEYREAYAGLNNAIVRQIPYEIYAMAKESEKNQKIGFPQALESAFNKRYSELPEKYAFRIADMFDESIQVNRNKFNKLLTNLSNDSIDYNSAANLSIAYLSYKAFAAVKSGSLKMISAKEHERYAIESFDLKTSKGGNITLTIVRKKGVNTPLPVIYTNNIYAGFYDLALGKRAAEYDYIGVIANARGKRTSTNPIEPFEHESEDSYDIIDWISKQPWSNGKVGMIGGSYLGFGQWAATKKLHPALKTIVPQVAVGIGIDYPMTNNVFMSYMMQWITYVTNNKFTDESDFKDYEKWNTINKDWFKSGKSFRKLDSISGKPNAIFQRWLDHPGYDDFWKRMVPYKDDFAKINIPVLTTTGFYDADQLGALYYFRQHYQHNKNPNHYLIIGPYDHGGAQSYAVNTLYNGYNIDPVAKINISDIAFAWFDYILKDQQKPDFLKDKVNVQIMGTNEWYHAPNLEKNHNSILKLYLKKGPDAKLVLDKEKPKKADFVPQTVDLKKRGEKNVYFKSEKDSMAVNNRIVFQTAVLDKDIIINGAFTAQIKAALNKKDADISIYLIQQKPDGELLYLSDYLGRASYAKNREKRQLLTPGKIETIPVANSVFVGKKIVKGSKLLVAIGINKSSAYQVNYGSGKDVSDETIADAGAPMEIKWYNDSYIEIPIFEK